MDEAQTGGDLTAPATVETAAKEAMMEMSQAQYADHLIKQATERAAPKEKVEATPATVAEVDAEAATPAPDKAVEANTDAVTEQEAPVAETPESDEVLSQSEPITPEKAAKWQENVNKRIGKLTADKKALEAQLESVLQKQPEAAPAPETVIVPMGAPDDKTVGANTEAELEKLARDAQTALDFIEDNQLLIQRAALRDEETVTIGGNEMRVQQIMDAKREARRHLERYIPARRKFLQAHTEAQTEAQKIFPAMFDRRTVEYQEFQAARRTNPALGSLPDAERLWALSRKGLAALQAEQTAATTPKVKPAAATAPKTAGDTGASAASKPTLTRSSSSDKARLQAELVKAEKRFSGSGSRDDYSQVLVLKSRLQKI